MFKSLKLLELQLVKEMIYLYISIVTKQYKILFHLCNTLQQLVVHSSTTNTWTWLLENYPDINSVEYVNYADSLLFVNSFPQNYVSKDYGSTFQLVDGLNGFVYYANDAFISVGYRGTCE